jgi:predicted AlkP superfamily phosphohydrolase/phosphomutase
MLSIFKTHYVCRKVLDINEMRHKIRIFLFLIIIIFTDSLHAYIGPGAGFALLSSSFVLVLTFILAVLSLFIMPVKLLIIFFRRRKVYSNALAKRVIVVGFDGLDPELCEKYISMGELPNFAGLKEQGCFKKLQTTFPSLSPVAWSSFATGVNPAKHRIYDFFKPNFKNYLPVLSSAKVEKPRRVINFGNYSIPVSKPVVSFLRRSKSFWRILGEHGIFSHIIRVPITFPPEKFYGNMLSGMCIPDILGTQGMFVVYTSGKKIRYRGGHSIPVKIRNNKIRTQLQGPENFIKKSFGPMMLSFQIILYPDKKKILIKINKENFLFKEKTFSPWIRVAFKPIKGISIRGICQFYLKQITPDLILYVSPVNIDPQKPALPISHPAYYSVYLAKLFGSYSSLGLAEDTWALNTGVFDEDAFIRQTYSIQRERELKFFNALEKTHKGFLAFVFDFTDRIQHMFFRYLTENHPANIDRNTDKYKNTVLDAYKHADKILGRFIDKISEKDVLMIISDHGFKTFIRGINLNTWLYKNGYLKLKSINNDSSYFKNVDWENTKAYASGLGGIYLNLIARERLGVVNQGKEAEALKEEISEKLLNLSDPENNKTVIRNIYNSRNIYSGPYINDAPDLIIGYADGYRISWDGAIGKVTREIFEDNNKCWSGDHAVDPLIVPGVIFCNKKIDLKNPEIIDIAPSVLHIFGIKAPLYMDGRVFFDFKKSAHEETSDKKMDS